MSAIRLAISELRRITAGRLPRLAVGALVLVPVLYAGFYLYANGDPYRNLDAVPAALVVEDTGAVGPDGTFSRAGDQVADELVDSGAFQWHRVDAAEADSGVRDNRYAFALTLPADFTAALQSSGDLTPRRASLVLTTNDANNYLVHTIADTVTTRVRDAVSQRVGTEAADRMLAGFSTIHDRTVTAADGASQLADGASQLEAGTGSAADGARRLSDGADTLAGGLDTLRDRTAALPAQSRQLADGARRVADGNAELAAAGEQVADAAQRLDDDASADDGRIASALRAQGFTDQQVRQAMSAVSSARGPLDASNARVQTLNDQLGRLGGGSAQVADGAEGLAAGASQLSGGISRAADGADALSGGAHRLTGGIERLDDGAGQLAGGAAQLRDGLREGADQIPDPDDPTRRATASTIGDPVAVRDVAQTTAGTYGAGLAPFFMALAAWIGGYVLFLLVAPLSRRAVAAGQAPLRVALGGWLPAAVLGVVQMTGMYLIVVFGLGIRPEHPLGTFAFLCAISLCFTAIVHALNAAFGAVGQFVGLVLMVLQLVSAGGTFPWQTIPGPLRPLHHALPMSYAVDGLRHLIYGGALDGLVLDGGVLLAWFVAAVLVAACAARRHRVWTPGRLTPELVL
ncbi:YhgE/Pip domain-containing protein [Pseudonocardia endophytica]|uniref:Putative membrane protein n=1 Tax=Pseudonocardia endophytica TaxID=401976 RepID=A0A4R1HUF1_PSEEN|nr:YhgE/Pip domain-containing protein [Pseudonocardia endophytica]TCK24575.1 putative membrane protein [Pseudonocardia endophytica]